MMEKTVGRTKDVGFQFGIRKTFNLSTELFWDFLFSDVGINIWLGRLTNKLELKKPYLSKEGTEGLVRILKPYSHIRLNWKKKGWKNMSTVQLRVIDLNEKTTVSIHQEKLLDVSQRNEVQEHWNGIMQKLANSINNKVYQIE